MRSIWILLGLLIGCGSTDSPAQFDSDMFINGPGAPERFACASDADCVIAPIPSNREQDPPAVQGCCGTVYAPANRAFADWVTRFKARYCANIDESECNLWPPPSPPPPCIFEVRCVTGQCQNGC